MVRETVPKIKRPGVDESGRTPLHYAAAEGDAPRVARLLREGAGPNAVDDNGWTPLHFAAQSQSLAAAQMLIDAGAKVDAIDSHGNTPLFRAVYASSGEGAVISLLRCAGAVATLKNRHGVSPLDLARDIANYNVGQFFADLK